MRPSEAAQSAPAEERRAWLEYLRWGLFVRAHAAAERAGVTDGAERFAFVRRQLDLADRPQALDGLLAHLAERYRAGETWVYDRPTLADVVGERMARRIDELGLLPPAIDRRELRPHTTRPLSRLRRCVGDR
jgi:hypothetical protein